MCVPESALRYYEEQLEREYIANENGFDSYEEYLDALEDLKVNNAIKSRLEENLEL